MNGEPADGERGSASVSGVAAMVVLLVVAFVGAQLGAAVIVRHRVTGAADLAALAAAGYLVEGDQYACEQAKRVASHNRAELRACAVSGWEVVVEVEAATPFGPVSVRSRAGPAEDRSVWSTTSGRLTAVSGLTLPSRHAER